MFDSYMNLSPAERRRVSVSDMRGYQIQRTDHENVLLYSFEDNVVYNAKIDKQFNKIVVQSVNHKFSDMEKRAMSDNPFGYEPVSPYRIRFPRMPRKPYRMQLNRWATISTHLLNRLQRLIIILLA